MSRKKINLTHSELEGYDVVKVLGTGAQGKVLQLQDKKTSLLYALKVFNFSAREEILEREMEIHTELRHPHIVNVYKTAIDEDQPFILMEYVDGCDLEKYMEINSLTLEEKISIIKDVSSGLVYLHSKGIMHRDVKPENIFITKNEYGLYAKLGDLGVAKKVGATTMNATGGRVGTPFYQPPEVHKGEGKMELKTDIYSLGMTLYYVLGNGLPFEENAMTFFREIAKNEDYRPVSQYNKEISSKIDIVCGKAIKKKKEERYDTVQAFCEELIEAAGSKKLEDEGIVLSSLEKVVTYIEGQSISDRGIWEFQKKNYDRARFCFHASHGEVQSIEYLAYMYGKERTNHHFSQYVLNVLKSKVDRSNYYSARKQELYYLLGMMFEFGIGTCINHEIAKDYYQKSAWTNKLKYHSVSKLYRSLMLGSWENSADKQYEIQEEAMIIWTSYFAQNYNTEALQELIRHYKKKLEMNNDHIESKVYYHHWSAIDFYLKKNYGYFEDKSYFYCLFGDQDEAFLNQFSEEREEALEEWEQTNKMIEEIKSYCLERKNEVIPALVLAEIYKLEENTKKARITYQVLSDDDNMYARFHLGLYYVSTIDERELDDFRIDYSLGGIYLDSAAQNNDYLAMRYLGKLLDREEIEDGRDYKYWIQQSAFKAIPGSIHAYIKEYSVSNIKAVNLYKEGVALEDPHLLYGLAQSYQAGNVVKKDIEKAKSYYEDLIDIRYPAAMVNLADMYLDDMLEEEDKTKKGLALYHKAAEEKDSNALAALGELYAVGGYEIEQDLEKAKGYLNQALTKDNYRVLDTLCTIICDLEENHEEADDLQEYLFFSDEENYTNYVLGVFNYKGCGLEKNYEKARKHFLRAAKVENHKAMKYLGDLQFHYVQQLAAYAFGKPTDEKCNLDEGDKAQVELNGGKKRIEKRIGWALEWYEKAAHLGNKNAMDRLKELYEGKEKLVGRDINKAAYWYKQSLAQEDKDEISNRNWRKHI